MRYMTILVERCDTWTEILAFLDRVNREYGGKITGWDEEVSYNPDEGQYRVAIKLKL